MDNFYIFDIIYYFFLSFILIPIGVALYRWKYLATPDKLIFYFNLFYLGLCLITAILLVNQVRNHFMYYFHTILSIWITHYYYFRTFEIKLKKNEAILRFLSVAVLSLMFLEIWMLGFNKINTFTLTSSRIFMCSLSVIYLNRQVRNYNHSSLDLKSVFWFYIGNFIFSFFSIFTNLFKNYFIETSVDMYLFFDMLSVLSNAIAFIVYAYAFGITKK